jgi:eukaryotic-like serine/threonine-protein kinase
MPSRPEDCQESSWAFAPGEEIAEGLRAWTLLGDGRRCETWLAFSLQAWMPVTVKLPRPAQVGSRAREALAREASRVHGLVHPGVQRLLDVRLDGPRPFLVFEYAEGPTLGQVLDQEGHLSPADTLRLGMQIGSVLHYLHGQGCVHLDLKPENLVVRSGRIILLDFDLSRGTGEGGGHRTPRGTPSYMAPEQVRCEAASPSMDLFALGATLFKAVSGQLAFPGVDPDAGPGGFPQLTAGPVPLTSLGFEVPEDLAAAIETLLARDPDDRPASALATLSLLGSARPSQLSALWPDWANEHLPGCAARPVSSGDPPIAVPFEQGRLIAEVVR